MSDITKDEYHYVLFWFSPFASSSGSRKFKSSTSAKNARDIIKSHMGDHIIAFVVPL